MNQGCWKKGVALGFPRHELERFRPALDDSIDRKRRWLAALEGAVKLRTVQKRAPVVARDSVGRSRLWSRTRSQNLVLQAARERDDAFLGLVRVQQIRPAFLIHLLRLFRFFHFFIFQ